MHMFTPMLAEVSDKMPAGGSIWAATAVISLSCLFCVAWRRRAAWVALPIVALWALVITSDIRDPHVGRAIINELGRGYVTQRYIAAAVPIVFVAAGFLPRRQIANEGHKEEKTFGEGKGEAGRPKP